MTDWKSPLIESRSGRAFVLFATLAFGLYLWEFLVTLAFDWNIVTGRSKWRWTYIPFFVARYSALLTLIVRLRITNAFEPIDCQAWIYVATITLNVAFGFGSFLLLLRVVAISRFNKYVIGGLGLLYAGDWAVQLYRIVSVRGIAFYVPANFACGGKHSASHDLVIFANFGFDVACLVVMLLLLLRHRGEGRMWAVLLSQGAVYIGVATAAYCVSLVLLLLNLNDAISEIAEIFVVVALSICATRMYRDLLTTATQTDPVSFIGNSGLYTPLPPPRPSARGYPHFDEEWELDKPASANAQNGSQETLAQLTSAG